MAHKIKVTLTTLHCLPIFQSIPDSQLEMIIPFCQALEYDQGEKLIGAGDVSTDFFVILSGTLRVVLRRADVGTGREKEVVLSYLQGGDFFGELSMIDAAPRSADVFAETDCCVVLLSGKDFREVIRRNVDITFYMLRNLAARMRSSDEKIRSFALDDVASRVLTELEKIAQEEGGEGKSIQKRVFRQDIAKRVGASREMVGRAIRDLEIRGEVTMKDGLLVLKKAA